MLGEQINTQVDDVRQMMAQRLRVRGKTLDAQVRKAGRLLPKPVRRDANYLAQAATVMDHPKLSRMVDAAKASSAHARITEFLAGVDPKDRARGKLLNWLGSLAFGFIVLTIVIVTVLVKRGLV